LSVRLSSWFLGFWQFGWVLGGKADQMARDRASTAVAEAVAPVCAAKFFAQPGRSCQSCRSEKTSVGL